MKISIICSVVVLVVSTGGVPLRAQDSSDGLWKTVVAGATEAPLRADAKRVQPDAFRLFTLNLAGLKEVLRRAPLESTAGRGARAAGNAETPALPEITVPTPDGTFLRVRVREAQIMEPALAAKFPELKAYRGEVVDQPGVSVQLDLTPDGFRAQVLAPERAFYVDPSGRPNEYKSYFRRDHRKGSDFRCLVPGLPDAGAEARREEARPAARSGQALRSYRLAVACTGEYTAFHGGTVAGALRAIFTTINRVDGIYESELAVRLILVGNNDRIIFTDAAGDGLDNDNANALIGQSQAKIDQLIGDANYDAGHTFSTGAGGLAGLGVVCRSGQKGRGVTGRQQPIGDAYDVDYVAHELGHQFGGNHTFNGSRGSCSGANRNGPTAFEPGSGTTIQAYAGICETDNLQMNSNPYFHCVSLDEMVHYTTVGAGNVPQAVPTGNNPPTVDAGPDRIIPKATPFVLTANGNDPDGDPLTYCWEQRDLGPQATLDAADDGRIPLFRSFEPAAARERIFPRLSALLANAASSAEKLPARARTMKFRVTARDHRGNGGGVNGDDLEVRVEGGAGPFKVSAPNNGGSFSGAITVTWDVARTHVAPVSASHVNILLSLDGGLTFRDTLAARTPNDGSQIVMLPDAPTAAARIKVEASDNIFFDVTDSNFTIAATGRAVVVAVVEENAPPERLSEALDSVNVDAIYTSSVTRKLADVIAQQRAISVAGTLEKEMLAAIQNHPSQRRILLLVPRAELATVTQLLNASTAEKSAPPEAPAVISLYSGALSESPNVLRSLDFSRP